MVYFKSTTKQLRINRILMNMIVQEETRLKNQKTHFVHLVSQETEKSSKRKPGKNKKKDHTT